VITFSKNKKGSSLIELLVYIFLLSVIVLILINTVMAMVISHRNIKIIRTIESSAASSMERMTREIRNAISVDVGSSILNTNPGKLVLNTLDVGGGAKIVEFYVDNGILKVKEQGVYRGPLSATRTRVNNLVFRQIDSTNSEAVIIEMQLEATTSQRVVNHNFYDTVILRGSY